MKEKESETEREILWCEKFGELSSPGPRCSTHHVPTRALPRSSEFEQKRCRFDVYENETVIVKEFTAQQAHRATFSWTCLRPWRHPSRQGPADLATARAR